MSIKKINLSFLVLASLIFSSFACFVAAQNHSNTSNNVFLDSDQDGLTDEEEKSYGTDPRKKDTDGDGYSDGAEVRSGYDPRKPAPGDKIIDSQTAQIQETKTSGGNQQAVLGESAQNENLTQKVASKLAELTTQTSSEDQSISLDEIQGLVDESLNSDESAVQLPEIKKEDLKILKQNYKKLSDSDAKARRKEDFLNYTTAVFYILSSNSPRPLTSSQNLVSVMTDITQEITSAITGRDAGALEDLNKSGEKITEQLKDVEVPEEMADSHIKILQFAYYSQDLKKYIQPNEDDPLGDIANLSKIEGFINTLSGFSDDIGEKFDEYEVKYDEDLQGKLKKYGIEPESTADELLKKLSE